MLWIMWMMEIMWTIKMDERYGGMWRNDVDQRRGEWICANDVEDRCGGSMWRNDVEERCLLTSPRRSSTSVAQIHRSFT